MLLTVIGTIQGDHRSLVSSGDDVSKLERPKGASHLTRPHTSRISQQAGRAWYGGIASLPTVMTGERRLPGAVIPRERALERNHNENQNPPRLASCSAEVG